MNRQANNGDEQINQEREGIAAEPP